jgi:hypothetical protein
LRAESIRGTVCVINPTGVVIRRINIAKQKQKIFGDILRVVAEPRQQIISRASGKLRFEPLSVCNRARLPQSFVRSY